MTLQRYNKLQIIQKKYYLLLIKFGGFLIFIYLCSRQLLSIMNKIYVMLFAAGFSTMAAAQEKFELGKPNDSNYRYLDEYKGLK